MSNGSPDITFFIYLRNLKILVYLRNLKILVYLRNLRYLRNLHIPFFNSAVSQAQSLSIYTPPQKKRNFPRCVSFETECRNISAETS